MIQAFLSPCMRWDEILSGYGESRCFPSETYPLCRCESPVLSLEVLSCRHWIGTPRRGVEEAAPDSNEYGGFLRATQCVERVVESPVENVVEWTQQANQQVVGFYKTPQTLSPTGLNGFKSPNRRGSFRPRLLPFQHCVIKDNTARIHFPWKESAADLGRVRKK